MSIKKVVLLSTCLCLALPLTAWANSVEVFNSRGQITSQGSSLTLNGSAVVGLSGLSSVSTTRDEGRLGTISLTTGNLISGSLTAGGTFAAGGSFTVSMMGKSDDDAQGGMLFTGTFTGPVTWTATFVPNRGPHHAGAWMYTLKGNVSGTLSNGEKLSGTIIETTFDVAQGKQFTTMARLDDGEADLSVPEPGTLGLLASGLVGLALLIRKKSMA